MAGQLDNPIDGRGMPLIGQDVAREMLAAPKAAKEFIENGIELGFIRMPDRSTPDGAHKTLPSIQAAIAKAEGR